VNYADVVNSEVIEEGLWGALLAIEDQATMLAPVALGALRNSISIATSKRESGFNTDGGAAAPQEAKITKLQSDYSGKVGTAIVYAAAQEYGRSEIGLPSQSYMRPAAAIIKAKLGGYFTPAIKEAAKELAQKRKVKSDA